MCLPCLAGFYCEEKTVTPTLKCEKGFYCPTNIVDGVSSMLIGSFGKYQVPCPARTYANVTGTPNLESCIPCPAGRYCLEATTTPELCTIGYYCPPGSETPTPCPIGTYGDHSGLGYLEDCTKCDRGK